MARVDHHGGDILRRDVGASAWGFKNCPTTTPARLGLRQSPNRQHRQCRTRLSASPVGFLLVLSKPSLNSFLSDVRAVGTVSVAAASERVFPILMMRVPARPRRARAPLHCPSTRRRSAMCPGCEPLPRLRRPPPRWRTGGLLCKHTGSGQRDRMPVQEIWRDFATAQPRILGALLDAGKPWMRALPEVRLEGLPGCAVNSEKSRDPPNLGEPIPARSKRPAAVGAALPQSGEQPREDQIEIAAVARLQKDLSPAEPGRRTGDHLPSIGADLKAFSSRRSKG